MEKNVQNIKSQALDLTDYPAEQLPRGMNITIIHADDFNHLALICELFRKEKVIGLDTETKPRFTRGEYKHPVALLQLSSATMVCLIRLFTFLKTPEKLEPLKQLLNDKEVLKVGVDINNDALALKADYNMQVRSMVDLRTLSKAKGIPVLSLSKIYATLFGKRISKSQRLSNWEDSILTTPQITYAALDAYAGLQIFNKLESYLSNDMIISTPQRSAKKKRNKKSKEARKKTEAKTEANPQSQTINRENQ